VDDVRSEIIGRGADGIRGGCASRRGLIDVNFDDGTVVELFSSPSFVERLALLTRF